ncbi:hypothetical protein E4O93_09060 [Diaphorobacter sp. DS2]|nr:hypothetical protein E4O93_09060 [Diaphorobacter sp. DS2]
MNRTVRASVYFKKKKLKAKGRTAMTNDFNDVIDDIRRKTKAGELPREARIAEIDRATEEWFARTGKMPDAKQLERLADLILHEELTDTDRMKVRNNEYPFFSDSQLDERYRSEASFKLADEQGVDGANHKPPVKRMRSRREDYLIDKKAKTKNKERQRVYTEFTKVQPVVTSNIIANTNF